MFSFIPSVMSNGGTQNKESEKAKGQFLALFEHAKHFVSYTLWLLISKATYRTFRSMVQARQLSVRKVECLYCKKPTYNMEPETHHH